MSHEEISFCQLRSKDIINEVDGRRLGKVTDLVFSPRTGCVLGIVAPFNRRGFVFRGQEVYIPYKNIVKIGPDVVLVKLTPDLSNESGCIKMGGHSGAHSTHSNHSAHSAHNSEHSSHSAGAHGGGHSESFDAHSCHSHKGEGFGDKPHKPHFAAGECDFKCEKCMLFDCSKRWRGDAECAKNKYYN